MRCTKCKGHAWVDIPRHHAAYCDTCFVQFFHRQVSRAIDEADMFGPNDSVLVAISGGKDSLALWDALLSLGHAATGLYVDLGIGEYSALSHEKAQSFASSVGADLLVVDLKAQYGLRIGEIKGATGRTPCSACGLAKRHVFNKHALDLGFAVIATGHNLDDEAATLLGNLLRWQTGYLARQEPALRASSSGLVKKVKPLYRLAERETAAYAVIRGLDYVVEECPNAAGASSLAYKEALNLLEERSPGTKQAFYWEFLRKRRRHFEAEEPVTLGPCQQCGEPTTARLCAFCRLVKEVESRMARRRPRGLPCPSGVG